MRYYLAPMEGITGYIYRNALQEFFKVPDKCITPFISPNQNRCMNSREKRDVAPENNQGLHIVPQIMTNRAENFIKTAKALKELGYTEVNLNLGCPSGTVVAKKRGSGFLAVPEQLDEFLEEIFEKSELKISIKTRLGIEKEEEFFKILDIYNKYPLSELIIHPRVQKDFYKNPPHMELFREAIRRSRHELCYNGDLFTVQDIWAFQQDFPEIDCIMLGRGLVVNPGLLNLLSEEEGSGGTKNVSSQVTKERIRAFHDRILEDYGQELDGEKNLLYKMKEVWFYMLRLFPDSEKVAKKIKKAQHLSEYQEIIDKLFREKELVFTEKLYF